MVPYGGFRVQKQPFRPKFHDYYSRHPHTSPAAEKQRKMKRVGVLECLKGPVMTPQRSEPHNVSCMCMGGGGGCGFGGGGGCDIGFGPTSGVHVLRPPNRNRRQMRRGKKEK